MLTAIRLPNGISAFLRIPLLGMALFSITGFSLLISPSPAPGDRRQATLIPTYTLTPTLTQTPTPASGASLAVEKSSAGTLVDDPNNNGLIDPGDTVRNEITYRNSGTESVTGIIVVADYDQTAVDSIANIAPMDGLDDKDKITWNIAELRPGETFSAAYDMKFKKSFPSRGSLTVENKFEISGENISSIITQQPVLLRIPNLKVTKMGPDQAVISKLRPGDTVTYTLKIQNVGDVEATDITAVDDYDQSLYNPPSNVGLGGVSDGGAIRWHFDRLPPATGMLPTEISISYDATLKLDLSTGINQVSNTVTVPARGMDPIFIKSSFDIEVVAPTPTAASTNTPAPEEGISAGPTAGGLDKWQMMILAICFLALALVEVLVCGSLIREDKKIAPPIRDAFILSQIMAVVIILGLAGSVERSAVAGLIGTIAGYVLRAAVDGNEQNGSNTSKETRSSQQGASDQNQGKIDTGTPPAQATAKAAPAKAVRRKKST